MKAEFPSNKSTRIQQNGLVISIEDCDSVTSEYTTIRVSLPDYRLLSLFFVMILALSNSFISTRADRTCVLLSGFIGCRCQIPYQYQTLAMCRDLRIHQPTDERFSIRWYFVIVRNL